MPAVRGEHPQRARLGDVVRGLRVEPRRAGQATRKEEPLRDPGGAACRAAPPRDDGGLFRSATPFGRKLAHLRLRPPRSSACGGSLGCGSRHREVGWIGSTYPGGAALLVGLAVVVRPRLGTLPTVLPV